MIARILAFLLVFVSTSRAELPEDMIQTFRGHLQTSKIIILVCIFDESLVSRTLPEKHRAHREATIVRTIKGDLKIGEKISYYSLIEEIPKSGLKSEIGSLEFLFLDEKPKGKFHLGTGSGWLYHSELDDVINSIKS